MAYTDSFGLQQHVGLGEGKDLNGCVSEVTFGAIHQISVEIRGEDMPKADADSLTIRSAKLPKGCAVLSAMLVVEAAAKTPATTLKAGTVELNGTDIDDDGLVAAIALSAGVKEGAGALVDTVVAKDSYIKVTPSATGAALEGLKAKLIVEYV